MCICTDAEYIKEGWHKICIIKVLFDYWLRHLLSQALSGVSFDKNRPSRIRVLLVCEFFYSEDILWRLPTLLKRWKMTKRNSFVAPSCLWLTSKPHSGDYYKIFHKELYIYIKKAKAKDQEMIVLSAIFFTLWQFCSHQFPALTLLKGRLDWIAEMCHHYQTKCSIARCTGPLLGAPCWTKKARNLAQIRCRISSMKNHHWKSWILKSRSWDSRHIPNSNDKDNWGQKYLNLHCMIICNAIRCSHDQCLIYKTYWPI